MLVTWPSRPANSRPLWRRGFWLGLLVVALAVLSLSPYLTASTELVRMRNALLLRDSANANFDWTPATPPADYLVERGPVDPFFVAVSERLELAALADDWSRAVAISRHLLGSQPVLLGGPVQADLRGTYEAIVNRGEGYCGDFVDVFGAIALAAGIPVRFWAFSFDGFGGHGHVWPEIWNRQLGRWQLVGVFNNYYFYETEGVALSALELRQAMLAQSSQLKLAPLFAGARLGWQIESKAWDYYRRGLAQWYMWWGNNLFTYDRSLAVRSLSNVSTSLEQLAAMAQGVHPPIKVLASEDNRDALAALKRLRIHLLLAAGFASLGLLLSLLCGLARLQGLRNR